MLADGGPPAGEAPPDWWTTVEEALELGAALEDRGDGAEADASRGTLRLVAPFVRRALRTLRAHPAGTRDAVQGLANALATELVDLARPTVAVELVIARATERWPADEARARAAALLRGLGEPARARALLAERPVLARLLADRAGLAIEAGSEVLERIAADASMLEELLGGPPGPAVAISASGDAHDGGRRVALVTFASGARAVLKPRSMAADAAYQRLLGELTRLGFAPAFASLATLEAGPDHGWQAFAAPASCTSAEQVERAFRRLGGQLAVLHALQATDVHQENVLACGEHPAVIDLETVLHPRLGGARADVVDPQLAETGTDCVLRVGLLPRADAAFGVDISGLGRDPSVVAEAEQHQWVGEGADARFVPRRLRLEAGDNAVRLDGVPVRPHDHLEPLARGFADAHRLLEEHREELLAPGGALDAFTGAPVRFVLRPTKVYFDLLEGGAADLDALADGRDREERLNVLWRGAVRRPELALVAPGERHDLWRGDVPKVTGWAGSADGHHHALGRLPGMLGPHGAPGPEVVRRLDARDRERQLGFLRSAVRGAAGPPPPRAAGPPRPPAGLGPDEARAAAVALARRLDVLALRHDGRVTWLAPVVEPPAAARVLRPLGCGVRAGQAGLALLLARVAALPGGSDLAGLAAGARRRLDDLLARAGAREGLGADDLAELDLALAELDEGPAGGAAPDAVLALARTLDPAALGTLPGEAESPVLDGGIAGAAFAFLALAGEGTGAAVGAVAARALRS